MSCLNRRDRRQRAARLFTRLPPCELRRSGRLTGRQLDYLVNGLYQANANGGVNESADSFTHGGLR